MIYDINGNILYSDHFSDVADNMELDYAYDSASNVNYTVLRVFQTKRDGTKQYPFLRYPGRMYISDFIASEGWAIAINAGLGVSASQPIDGIAIENGVVIYDSPATYHLGSIPLTIDANGNLDTASADASAASLAANGIVSATCGFCPIIEDYGVVSPLADVNINGEGNHFASNAMRTIIGQFGNGDYALIVCAGRNLDHSDGWTMAEAQTVCQRLGLKFAYNLDGGKSTSMYLGKHPVYDFMLGTTRIIPSFIVFNGTDTFSIPPAV